MRESGKEEKEMLSFDYDAGDPPDTSLILILSGSNCTARNSDTHTAIIISLTRL
jgi:hypothetical protein